MSTKRYEISDTASAVSADILKRIHKCKVQYIGEAFYENDWQSIIHYHSGTELFYCLSGTGRFAIKNNIIPLAANDMILVPPHIDHTEYSILEDPMEYIVIGIGNLDLPLEDEADYIFLQCNTIKKDVIPLLHLLVQQGRENSSCCSQVCKNLLDALLMQIFHILLPLQTQKAYTVAADLTAAQIQCATKECAAVYRYINEHFKDEITLDLLSELSHINKYYLSHSFKTIYGVSPIRYLLGRRIEESKYLLANTNHSLIQIAEMTGFSSSSYFSQSFRRITNQTPSQYRFSKKHGTDTHSASSGSKKTAAK